MPKGRASPESRLPLSDLELLILLALVEEPLHGYALLARVNERSSGFVQTGPTTLYRTIANLVADELIEEAPHLRAPGEDVRRKYFRNTSHGRAVLRAELRRLSGLLDHARELGISYQPGGR